MSEQRCGKGDRPRLPERPAGCLAQTGPVPFSADELYALFNDSCDGALSERGAARLDQLLARRSGGAIRIPGLPRSPRGFRLDRRAGCIRTWDNRFAICYQRSAVGDSADHRGLVPAPHAPLFTLHSPVGSFLFSYTMAALLLAIALAAGWTWRFRRSAGCGG